MRSWPPTNLPTTNSLMTSTPHSSIRDDYYSSPPPPSPSPSFAALINRNKRTVALMALILLGLFLVFYVSPMQWGAKSLPERQRGSKNNYGAITESTEVPSCRYSSQQAFLKYNEQSTEFRIALIADMDKLSKDPDTPGRWRSVLKRGTVHRNPKTREYSVDWKEGEQYSVYSGMNEAGRGMELSDLTYFDGKLLTFDDRTGLIYRVVEQDLIPWRILMDGNGHSTKGMKIEWATVKDNTLYVGSTGKEWTTPQGEFVNNNPLWVKTIDRTGVVTAEDWLDVFTKLRKATGTHFPGYLLHEAVRWNASNRRWYFIPRRSSTLAYDEDLDEERGTNLVLSTDEDFSDVQVLKVGEVEPSHGFSAFQFVPYHEDEIVAIRTQELKGKIATYIMAFDLEGNILMHEKLVGEYKFEGLEFI